MEIAEVVRAEWAERHALGRAACHWLTEHAEAGDPHPITTAVEQLRVLPDVPREA